MISPATRMPTIVEAALDPTPGPGSLQRMVEARRSILKQKNELLYRSHTQLIAYQEKIMEINKEISVLKAKNELDHTALKALQETKSRFSVESSRERHMIVKLQEDYDKEEKEFNAYLAKMWSDRRKLKPLPEIGLTEGDTFLFIFTDTLFLCL
jgi:hypothetical protein